MAYAERRGKDRHGLIYYRGRYLGADGTTWHSITYDPDTGARFRTKRAAERAAEAMETDVRRGTWINPQSGRTTLREWAEVWTGSVDAGPSTMEKYTSRLRVVLAAWGDVAVADITPVGITTWERRLRDHGYAPNTIDGYRSLLRMMLEDAALSRLIAESPMPQHNRRRGRYRPKKRTEDRAIATPRQVLLIARNAAAVRGLSMYVLVLTSAYTGMRIAELAALRRSQVELRGAGGWPWVHVEHQVQYVDGRRQLIGAKYGSERGLILPTFLGGLLAELMESHDRPHVFTAPQGGEILCDSHWYRASWWPAVEGRAPIAASRGRQAKPGVRPVSGVEGLEPHGLRHSHKVWLDEGGHPRVAAEARMGHELPGVEGVYSHVTLPMEVAIAEGLQRRWEESLRPVIDRREFGPTPRGVSQKSPKRRSPAPPMAPLPREGRRPAGRAARR